MTSFPRTIGPKADVSELQYVAALHQTCQGMTRPTGTISSLDVCRFLKSRHFLEITHAQARDIVQALGGGQVHQELRVQIAEDAATKWQQKLLQEVATAQENMTRPQRWKKVTGSHKNQGMMEQENDGAGLSPSSLKKEKVEEGKELVEEILSPKLLYLDVVQMTSILLIPTLARFAKEWYNANNNDNKKNVADAVGNEHISTSTRNAGVPTTTTTTTTDSISATTVYCESELDRLKNRIQNLQEQNDDDDDNANGRKSNGHEQPMQQAVYTSGSNIEVVKLEGKKDGGLFGEGGSWPFGNLFITDTTEDVDRTLEPQPTDLLEVVLHRLWSMIRETTTTTLVTTPPDATDQTRVDEEEEDDDDDDNVAATKNNDGDRAPNFFLEAPVLTVQVIQTLLMDCGEVERANDLELIQRMIQVATKDGGGTAAGADPARDASSSQSDGDCRLDEAALVRALTSDLQDWTVGCEDHPTTYVQDVFGSATLESFDRVSSSGHHHYRRRWNSPKTKKGGGESNSSSLRSKKGRPEEEAIMEVSAVGENEENSSDVVPMPAVETVEEGLSSFSLRKDKDDHVPEAAAAAAATLPKEAGEKASTDESAAFIPPLTKSPDTQEEEEAEDFVELNNKPGYEALDTVVDAYGSNATLLLTWLTFIGHTGTYASLLLQLDAFKKECVAEFFGCTLGKTVISWMMVALLLTVFGFFVLLPLSYGNHPTSRGPARMLAAAILALVITLVPFLVLQRYGETLRETASSGVVEEADSEGFVRSVYLTTTLGLVLAGQYFLHCCIGVASNHGYTCSPGSLVHWFSSTSHVVGTARSKQAATRKINKLLMNARSMHGTFESLAVSASRHIGSTALQKSESDTVFQNFTLRGESTENAASLLWVWEHILDGSLFDTEGIWLPARLIIFQFGQISVAVLVLFLFFFFIDEAAKAADVATADLESQEGLPSWVYDLVPSGAEVTWALIPAASISVAVCCILTMLYIPSTVITVLKYRCGQYGALGDETFRLARAGPDAAYMNTANAIYGMLAASSLFFILIGLLLFLFLWDFTRRIVLLILAWGIGLGITIGLKMIMTSFCRKQFFRAFYRIHPARANITSLALECWFIGLGGGVLIGRITQFLLASAFWIGRIDEPFLADNVSLFGYKFDYVPLNYIKEILVHEAHRHPYIERLGTMYLMRLKYKSFANSDASACWRQLFVLTLLPWLMKYRVFHEQRCIESLQDQKSELQVQVEEDREPLAAVAGDIMDTTLGIAGMVDGGAKTVGHIGLGVVGVGAKTVGQVGKGAVEVGKGAVDVGMGAVDARANLFTTNKS